MKNRILTLYLLLAALPALAQQDTVRGRVTDKETQTGLAFVEVSLPKTKISVQTDSVGNFAITVPAEAGSLRFSYVGYQPRTVIIKDLKIRNGPVELTSNKNNLDEVVVTGTLKEISRLKSAVPVEIITPQFFRKNPTPSLFEAVGMLNGVQPQLNCNVCNTGDIHINGMEGPYTMILIDGMPIVSSLSTVYGLSGIPNSIVERIEVVKGPASSLYGSEAMGGIINVITKNPVKASKLSVDFSGTSWKEFNADAAVKMLSKKTENLLGISYFNYSEPYDKNKDGFTDVTLQNRISIFDKINFIRKSSRLASLGGRYVYEDRWGGQTGWNKQWRGTDSIYGESIYTKRYEIIGLYQLPVEEKFIFQFSYNWHNQNSYYGTTPYFANQQVAFGQLFWDKEIKKHNLLFGTSVRFTRYDDNTIGTSDIAGNNRPEKTPIPGIFVQDEWTISDVNTLLFGYRYDYQKNHGGIHSPRIAYKWAPNSANTIRVSAGTGFRVVNLFTEDHAALTGSREVVIKEKLNPERSFNANLNYVLKVPGNGYLLNFDATGFYSYFTNKIVGDFDSDPQKIIYDNLNGYAVSKGVSLNSELAFDFPLKAIAGVSYMNVYQMEKDANSLSQKNRQLHSPTWSGNFVVSYTLKNRITVDLTGKWSGPMRLPILPNDYRPEFSPNHSIVNLQLSRKFNSGIEVYGGVKNLFNFVPGNPIMRPFDPFDKNIGVNNPNGYTFDPNYNYASLQGSRGFLGLRYLLK